MNHQRQTCTLAAGAHNQRRPHVTCHRLDLSFMFPHVFTFPRFAAPETQTSSYVLSFL